MWQTTNNTMSGQRLSPGSICAGGRTNLEKADRHEASRKISIWIADDNEEYRQTLEDWIGLSKSVSCARSFSSCESMIRTLNDGDKRPEVVLLDIRFPGMDGIKAISRIKSIDRGIGVLMLTISNERTELNEAFGHGADGYLTKSSGGESILRAIHDVAEGRTPIDARMGGLMVERYRTQQERVDHYGLTLREREVLRLLSEKEYNADIAEALFLSVQTIETHVKHICVKLGCRNRTLAVAKAMREKLI